jgi:hypothetical protein
VYSLAEALAVSPAMALNCLDNSVGMKIFHLRRIPRQLTDDLQQVMVAKCREVLRVQDAVQRTGFRHVVTTDESWIYLKYQHASQWLVSRDKVSQSVKLDIGTGKFMINGYSGRQRLPCVPGCSTQT